MEHTQLAQNTKPLSLTKIIGHSFSYAKQVTSAAILFILLIVGWDLVQSFVEGLFPDYHFARDLVFLLIGALVSTILELKFTVTVIYLANGYWADTKVTFAEALQAATINRCLQTFLLGIRIGVMTVLWGLCLVLPGLVYGMNRSLALYALLLDNLSPTNALQKSKYLMTHGKWYSLSDPWTRISTLLLFIAILSLFLMSFAAGITETYGNENGLQFFADSFTALCSCLIQIFTWVAMAGFYRDLVNRYGEKPL